MAESMPHLKGKRILVVDDEVDILETIEDILDESRIDTARDYESASRKIAGGRYDLAVFDIMGVNGLKLLDEAVARGIPSIMLTAHAVNPETLMASIQKGAISYLPKESLADLDALINELLGAHESGKPPWKLLFDRLGAYFDKRFGADWKEADRDFWSEFSRTYQIGKGIQERLKHSDRVRDKGGI